MKQSFAILGLFILPFYFLNAIESNSVVIEKMDGLYGISSFLYLPEFASGQKRVTIFDSEGTYKGTLSLDLPSQQMDRIWELDFCEDGSFYVVLSERIGWIISRFTQTFF